MPTERMGWTGPMPWTPRTRTAKPGEAVAVGEEEVDVPWSSRERWTTRCTGEPLSQPPREPREPEERRSQPRVERVEREEPERPDSPCLNS